MSIKHAILGLLHYKDMYGYELKDLIEKHFTSAWTVNYGQIYTSLKALAADEHIVLSEVVPSETGAPHKKLYSLTDKGREEFKNWLKSEPEKRRLHRDPFIMRFIFFGFGEKEDALRLIEEQIRLYEQGLATRKEELPRSTARGPYSTMIRELGIAHNETHLEWLRKARERILNMDLDEEAMLGKCGARLKPASRKVKP